MSPAAENLETNPKVITRSSPCMEPSRRVEVTREMSRVDAIAGTRHFFTTVSEQRNTTELPVVTATDVLHVNIPSVSHDLIETEPTEPGTTSSWTYLPNGSPLDPPLQLPVDLKHGYNMYQKDKLRRAYQRR